MNQLCGQQSIQRTIHQLWINCVALTNFVQEQKAAAGGGAADAGGAAPDAGGADAYGAAVAGVLVPPLLRLDGLPLLLSWGTSFPRRDMASQAVGGRAGAVADLEVKGRSGGGQGRRRIWREGEGRRRSESRKGGGGSWRKGRRGGFGACGKDLARRGPTVRAERGKPERAASHRTGSRHETMELSVRVSPPFH